jgi:hypothetical protein
MEGYGEVSKGLSEDPSIERPDKEYERDNEDLVFRNQEGSIHQFGADFNQLDYELDERNNEIDLEIDKRFVFDFFETNIVLSPEEVLEDHEIEYATQLREFKTLCAR